ncbi:DUF3626 domain-containing protein [Serratia marcescens]
MLANPVLAAILHISSKADGEPLPTTMPVTLNFHPDALYRGMTMIEALAEDGVYRSQFETHTSNGGLTAYPGGDRWAWENAIFGMAYADASPELRPKYGALNYRNSITGGSPRFGSSHFRMRPAAMERTTFCYPDSFFAPSHFATAEKCALIELAERDNPITDVLDNYIEAHIHGIMTIADDVEAVVLDGCYKETPIDIFAHRLACPVEWHPGYRLAEKHLPECVDYRGKEIADLARKLVNNGFVTPFDIGLARGKGYDPQHLKKVWHCVAKFGSPIAE